MDKLDQFYEGLRKRQPVTDFLARYQSLWPFVHEAGLTEDYRLARGRLKRMRDEVKPMALFCEANKDLYESIAVPLDDGAPDCHMWAKSGEERLVQITISQGFERLNLARELNDTGQGRAYLGVEERAGREAFDTAVERPREMYTAEQAVDIFMAGLCEAISRKTQTRGNSILIVSAPFEALPAGKWEEAKPAMVEIAASSPFPEVFVVGNTDASPLVLRLK